MLFRGNTVFRLSEKLGCLTKRVYEEILFLFIDVRSLLLDHTQSYRVSVCKLTEDLFSLLQTEAEEPMLKYERNTRDFIKDVFIRNMRLKLGKN